MSLTDRNEPLTLTRGRLAALMHIAAYAQALWSIAKVQGLRADLTPARALASMHNEPERTELLGVIDDIERRAKAEVATYSDEELSAIPRSDP